MPEKLPVITLNWLKRQEACLEGRKLFAATFGKGARVAPTRENLRRAAEVGMDIQWLAYAVGRLDSEARIRIVRRISHGRCAAARATEAAVARAIRVRREIKDAAAGLDPEDPLCDLARISAQLAENHAKFLDLTAVIRERRTAVETKHRIAAAELLATALELP